MFKLNKHLENKVARNGHHDLGSLETDPETLRAAMAVSALSGSMRKVGTWFLTVHITSHDRIWSKVNYSSGALAALGVFRSLGVFLSEEV